jgi:hypothetical protein
MPLEEQAPEINLFDGPIAGQSMTASPESKMDWDGPPEYSSVREASEAIFLDILEEDNLKPIVTMLQDGVPVSDITQVLLLTGFSKGKFNPDLLMLLIEPVMYMIMAVADKFGITNVKIYKGEEEDDDSTEELSGDDYENATMDSLQKIFKNQTVSPDLRKMEESEIGRKLAGIDVESLMAKPEGQPEEIQTESLLAREE